jgi:hypothetical protein
VPALARLRGKGSGADKKIRGAASLADVPYWRKKLQIWNVSTLKIITQWGNFLKPNDCCFVDVSVLFSTL